MKNIKHCLTLKKKKIIFQLIWKNKILYSIELFKNSNKNIIYIKYLEFLIESGLIIK
jgi:hypothetical protein